MVEDPIITRNVQGLQQQHPSFQKIAAQRMTQYLIAQETTSDSFQEWTDLTAWNPLALSRNFQTLRERTREKLSPEKVKEGTVDEEGEELEIKKLQAISESYERENPELEAASLLALRVRLSKRNKPDEILEELQKTFVDPSLRDEALDFLLEVSTDKTVENLKKAKEELIAQYGREIQGGRNIGIQARAFSAQGLGSPTALRDLYRHITANPREAHPLFQELSATFPFDKMKVVINFILHSIGADLKSKGPSISRGELQRQLDNTRDMQAILGVYRFFSSRMRGIVKSFHRQQLMLAPRVNFEELAKTFMRFIQERYPSIEKALLLSQPLGLSGQLQAQSIIYPLFRDALRNVSPRLFRDEKSRQEILFCLMETLKELEKREKEEKEEKKKKNSG